MAEQEVEKIVNLISALIDAKITDVKVDSGDAYFFTGMSDEEYRIRNSLEKQLAKALEK